MIISSLILIITVLALLQEKHRRTPALICALLLLIHDNFMVSLDGVLYYLSDAMFCFIIIFMTANLKETSRLIVKLHYIFLIGIVLNLYGWVIWMLYLPPTSYNVAFMLLYTSIIIVLLSWDGVEHGNYKIDRWWGLFRLSDYKGLFSNFKISRGSK